MDTDSSGAITYDELKEGLRKYGSTLKESEIRDLMDAVSLIHIEIDHYISCQTKLNVDLIGITAMTADPF